MGWERERRKRKRKREMERECTSKKGSIHSNLDWLCFSSALTLLFKDPLLKTYEGSARME